MFTQRRWIIDSKGKVRKIPIIGFNPLEKIYIPALSPALSPTLSPTLSPSFSPIFNPTFNPTFNPIIPIAPGVFLTPSSSPAPPAVPAVGAAGAAGAGAGAAAPAAPAAPAAAAGAAPGAPAAPAAPITSPLTYNLITPNITNIRNLTHPDQDPELRKKVVKHFYNQLKEVYFLGKFQKLLKYVIVDENNKVRLVNSFSELQQNKNNNNNFTLRIKFITENIFSKYDLEVLISKLIAKYSMLYSEDEDNIHWYNAKYKHASIIKKAMYKKIKYRLQKKVNF